MATHKVSPLVGKDSRGDVIVSEALVRKMLRLHCKAMGGQAEVARKVGVGRSHINGILSGRKRPYGKVLAYLGLEKVEYIREVDSEN